MQDLTSIPLTKSNSTVGASTTSAVVDEHEDSHEEEMDDYSSFRDEFEATPLTVTPGRLRGQIRKLLETTDIKITELQRMLGVNANSYGKFMNGKYKDPWAATQNGTYHAAAYFFFREKMLGKNALGKTRAHGAAAAGGGGGAAAAAGKPKLPDISGIETDGRTWLTPGEVRRELRALLQAYDTSVAALARLADVPYQSFMKFCNIDAGDFGGEGNQAYHPAAELAEKFRIARGKGKGTKRSALEAEVATGRVDRCTGGPLLGLDPNKRYMVFPGAHMTKDALGRHTISYA